MLVLTRHLFEEVKIGDDVDIRVTEIAGDKVKLGFTAPRSIQIYRKEVYDAIRRENPVGEMRRKSDLLILKRDDLLGRLEFLVEFAKRYRPDAVASIRRNGHMHELVPGDTPTLSAVDAVLANFINFIGVSYGIDYALYASDFTKPQLVTAGTTGTGE